MYNLSMFRIVCNVYVDTLPTGAPPSDSDIRVMARLIWLQGP